MTPHETGKHLHHKATLGLPLTADEQAALAAWYARLDEEEGNQLAAAPSANLTVLREQVHTTLTQIISVAQQIQKQNQENEALRSEIVALQERLALEAP